MMKHFNLRSCLRCFLVVELMICRIREMIDCEYEKRIVIIGWRPDIDSVSNERTSKIGPRQTFRCEILLKSLNVRKLCCVPASDDIA